ncbi:hypothetical protein EDD29_6826 [Actinocorallia herbida]|uniref:Uncharacterized protein n=1 Tax=Actinocorallia herbida TaxID=58109 RepID=A0A3N1D6P7_9ACTN|nr:hypothetical protein [Actinocorallia herbida]ROO89139.1 hypothetical protein EDD29_6826 [Actinocorallia herbida]
MRSLCALAAAALLALPATAASAAPVATSGMVVPIKAVEASGQALDVLLLYSCEPKNETAVLTASFSQTEAKPGARAAVSGKVKEDVECGTLRRHTIQIPVMRDGPLVPGSMATITTQLHNAAGVRLHTATSVKKVQAIKKRKKRGGGLSGKSNPLGSPLSGLFGSLIPR